ncbi:response regulator [Streptacidiphilus sp. N1-3]|uniref:Response regulator n=1 Tax=Streptacidiphilus alkalitolerans TaxID=3342712 RepID=A0ABV6XC27_9ACTN
MIRVLLADDQDLLRRGFKMIIDAQSDMEAVAEAANGAQAITQAAALRPDVVLMDVRMPGTNGIEATRHIAAHLPDVKVLILTTFDVDEYAFAGLQAGASGFLLKNARTEELIAGIRTVAAGEAILAPSTTRRLLDTYASTFHATGSGASPTDVLAPLTQRERQVFTEMASGCTNQEIADRLVLSETTVKTHVARVLAKLRLRDRIQAVIFAYENGVVPPSR